MEMVMNPVMFGYLPIIQEAIVILKSDWTSMVKRPLIYLGRR